MRCRDCGGKGGVETRFGHPESWRGCPTCHGTGEVAEAATLATIAEQFPASDHPAYEHARQIWVWLAGGNAEETRRILLEPPDPTREDSDRGAYDVPSQTIRRWARDHDWAARADIEVRTIAPAIHAQVVREVTIGKLAGARYLRRVADGSEPPNKDRIQASTNLMFFGGHKFNTSSNDDVREAAPQVDYGPSVAGRDVAELMAVVYGDKDQD